jgi:hypothetical protein
MDDLARKTKDEEHAKSEAALKEISDMLATFDGVSTGDAFRLACLVQKYGDARAGEAVGPIMHSILGSFEKAMDKQNPPKNPWEA